MTTISANPSATSPDAKDLAARFRYLVVFAVLTLLHIKWGALVVSSGSGMAFLDWPMSRGSLWPEQMTRNELVEHLHRWYGALIGLLSLTLSIWMWRTEPRGWLRNLGFGLLTLVIFQGILGGLGVVYGKAGGVTHPIFATAHGVLGQVTLCVQVFLAFAHSRSFERCIHAEAGSVRTTRKLAAIALGAVFLQLLLGAIFRHTNVTGVLWVHITMAMFVAVMVLLAAAHSSARFGELDRGFKTAAVWFYVLLVLQITLGFAAIAVRRFKDPSSVDQPLPLLVVSSHVIIGAALFALSTLLVARAWRTLSPVGDRS